MWKRVLASVVVVASVFGLVWAKGDWSAAQSKAEDLKRKQMDLRRLMPDEVRKMVRAICDNAEDHDARAQVGRDAVSRVQSLVQSEMSTLERMRDDAFRAIDEVLSDEELKDKHDSARSLREEVKQRMESIDKMWRGQMRGGNHPVVSYMSLKGIEEHKNYQRSSSNCHAYEFNTGSRRADCLRADGETCYVIELKPNNSRARSLGERQARDSVDDLNRELEKGEKSDIMKELINRKSDFAKCKQWKWELRCWTLCPDVNDEAEHREDGVRWGSC